MQRMLVGLEGIQTLIDLTSEEIAEIQAQPAPIIPARSANKYDLTLALLDMDLYDDLEAAVNSVGRRAQLQWAATTIVSEDDPLVVALIAGLGWSDAIVDEIFDRIRQMNQSG